MGTAGAIRQRCQENQASDQRTCGTVLEIGQAAEEKTHASMQGLRMQNLLKTCRRARPSHARLTVSGHPRRPCLGIGFGHLPPATGCGSDSGAAVPGCSAGSGCGSGLGAARLRPSRARRRPASSRPFRRTKSIRPSTGLVTRHRLTQVHRPPRQSESAAPGRLNGQRYVWIISSAGQDRRRQRSAPGRNVLIAGRTRIRVSLPTW